jgi:site-specific recombinase XerD
MKIRKRTNGNFYIEYFDEVEQKSRRISTGSKNKDDSFKFLYELDHHLDKREKTNLIDLETFHKKYVNFVSRTFSKNYIRSINLSFEQLLKFIGNKPLLKITRFELSEFIIESFQRTQHSAALYNRTLKAAFNKAIEWNYLYENPFAKVKVPKIPKTLPLFLSESEFKIILENTMDERLRYFCNLLSIQE